MEPLFYQIEKYFEEEKNEANLSESSITPKQWICKAKTPCRKLSLKTIKKK